MQELARSDRRPIGARLRSPIKTRWWTLREGDPTLIPPHRLADAHISTWRSGSFSNTDGLNPTEAAFKESGDDDGEEQGQRKAGRGRKAVICASTGQTTSAAAAAYAPAAAALRAL